MMIFVVIRVMKTGIDGSWPDDDDNAETDEANGDAYASILPWSLQNYGPPAGGETLEEARLREKRELEERERRLREIEEMRAKQVIYWAAPDFQTNGCNRMPCRIWENCMLYLCHFNF